MICFITGRFPCSQGTGKRSNDLNTTEKAIMNYMIVFFTTTNLLPKVYN